jgi:predicted house-cleaning NTP pyrophosphatase (Maf/HAM1 superfamily)
MNANELADKLMSSLTMEYDCDKYMEQAATMLRQQQEKIEDLINAHRFVQNFAEEQHQRAVALEMRELTDDEINKTYLEKYDGHMGFLSPDEVREFARAILRKAQNK